MENFIFRKTKEVVTELSPEEMGKAFAEAGSIEQSIFLNEAFNQMDSWLGSAGAFQISHIAGSLSKNSMAYLRELVAHFDEED